MQRSFVFSDLAKRSVELELENQTYKIAVEKNQREIRTNYASSKEKSPGKEVHISDILSCHESRNSIYSTDVLLPVISLPIYNLLRIWIFFPRFITI